MNPVPEPASLDRILRQTLEAIEQSKEEIFLIAESARSEKERVLRELERVREEARRVVDAVDRLQQEDQEARRRLAEVSRGFDRYTEEDIRQAYEAAREIQVRLAIMKEREKQLLARRRELEIAWRRLEETQARAERLVSRVGVAMEFLSESLRQVWETADRSPQDPQLALAVIQAQEEERRRIARGIHDGPAQGLAQLVMQAEYCRKLWEMGSNGLPEELDHLKKRARELLEEIRKIIFDLLPVNLGDGVARALERYVSEFQERAGLAVRLECRGSRTSYPPQAEIAVFRIVQEALNNVRKHAGAGSAKVVVECGSDFLAASVEDRGRGFDPQEVAERDTFGLASMREWARLANGRLEVVSRPGQGTKVRVRIEVRND